MKRMLFKNSARLTEPSVIYYAADCAGTRPERLELTESGEVYFDFNDEKYRSFRIVDDGGIGTQKIFPGKLALELDYKRNDRLDRELTYLSPSNGRSGRVENFILKDNKYLSYRKDKSKKISVFLPESYDSSTPYDVLYFFDGQNLFCDAGEYTDKGDPYGSWQLDIAVNQLARQYGKNIIVVGIDNSDEYRSRELFMSPKSFGKPSDFAKMDSEDEFAEGYLDGLASFITDTLHPFVKDRYSVKDDCVGIGGASMGGIASLYCGLNNMDFYKYVISYSPAYALYNTDSYERYFIKSSFAENPDILPSIHIYCGGGDMLENILLPSAMAMKDLLCKYGYDGERIFETYDTEKPHNEESWRLILPESLSLLLI